jgi:hypothetical protein
MDASQWKLIFSGEEKTSDSGQNMSHVLEKIAQKA